MSLAENKKIGFIGAGKMAEAIFSGFIKSGLVKSKDIYATALREKHLEEIKEKYSINVIKNDEKTEEGAKQIARTADVLIIAVEPSSAQGVIEASAAIADERNILVISIVGGKDLAYLESFYKTAPVARVMPNTPMTVGEGVAGIVMGTNSSKEDEELVKELFSSVGLSLVIPENLLDPLTGISGCGPAFIAMFAQSLSDGGVLMGLPRSTATELAAKTLIGTGKMILESGIHPEKLKDNVCTPGGGTIAGVKALEDGNLRSTVINAVEKSVSKMGSLSKK